MRQPTGAGMGASHIGRLGEDAIDAEENKLVVAARQCRQRLVGTS